MSQTYDAIIIVKDNSKRMKIQLAAMIFFMISIAINMLYSNYYILVLFAPFFILLNRYRILKRNRNYYINCKLTTVFSTDSVRLIVDDVPDEFLFDSILTQSNISNVDFYDDETVKITCKSVLNKNEKYIKKKTLYFKLNNESYIEFKNSMIELLEKYN